MFSSLLKFSSWPFVLILDLSHYLYSPVQNAAQSHLAVTYAASTMKYTTATLSPHSTIAMLVHFQAQPSPNFVFQEEAAAMDRQEKEMVKNK